jgi:hypothetical protein
VRDYRFQRGGYDLLAARAGAEDAAAGAPAFRVVAEAKPVRRGTEFGLRTPAGIVAMTLPEVEAAAWIMARPAITEAELRASHPGCDAGALIARLRQAGVLAA